MTHELPVNGIVSVDFDKREITLRLSDFSFRELREDGFRIHHLASDAPVSFDAPVPPEEEKGNG